MVVLTLVGLVSGSLLAIVGMLTKDRIAYNRQKEIEAAILKVVPGSASSDKLYEEENITVYGGKDSEDRLIGYAVYASGTGFQDMIRLMFGTNSEVTKINALDILEQKETPGLGAKVTDYDTFLRFWENKDARDPLTLRKPAAKAPEELSSSEVNTITGATISSEKVLEIANASLEQLKQIKKEGKLTDNREE